MVVTGLGVGVTVVVVGTSVVLCGPGACVVVVVGVVLLGVVVGTGVVVVVVVFEFSVVVVAGVVLVVVVSFLGGSGLVVLVSSLGGSGSNVLVPVVWSLDSAIRQDMQTTANIIRVFLNFEGDIFCYRAACWNFFFSIGEKLHSIRTLRQRLCGLYDETAG